MKIMSHIIFVLFSLFLSIKCFSDDVFANDGPNAVIPTTRSVKLLATSTASSAGESGFAPLAASDVRFVTSWGGDLHEEVWPGGTIKIPLIIDRVFGDIERLLHFKALPEKVTLLMRVYDVDSDYKGSNPEKDDIYVNGKYIGTLSGNDGKWTENTFSIPIEYLNLKEFDGDDGVNELTIKVGTGGGNWVTKVDWITVTIPAPPPVVIAHGIRNTAEDMKVLSFAIADMGLPVHTFDFKNNGNNSIKDGAKQLEEEIKIVKDKWHVQHVNIVAHSMGGLKAREYAEDAKDVAKVLQIATPNAGAPMANWATVYRWIMAPFKFHDGIASLIKIFGKISPYDPAVYDLRPSHMEAYNQIHSYNSDVYYRVVAGAVEGDFSSLFDEILASSYNHGEWGEDGIIKGDGIVPLESAHNSIGSYDNSPVEKGENDASHGGLVTSGLGNVLKTFLKDDLLDKKYPERLNDPIRLADSKSCKNPNPPNIVTGPIYVNGGVINIDEFLNVGAPFDIIKGNDATIMFGAQYDNAYSISLKSPSGSVYTSSSDLVSFEQESNNYNIRLSSPEAGRWHIMIASDAMMVRRTVSKTEIPYAMFVYEKNSKVSIDVWLEENSVCAGESFIVNVKPTLDGANVSGRVVLKMCPQSSTNSAHITTCVLSNSVDGVYTGQMSTDSADEYDIFVTVESDSPSVFTRNASISGIAYAPIADVGGDTIFAVEDINGNGLYDYLLTTFKMSAATAGTFRVYADLFDATKDELIVSGWTTNIYCSAGSTNLTVRFDGNAIYSHGESGGYSVRNVRLVARTEKYEAIIARAEDATTNAYDFRQFEHPLIAVVSGGTDQAVDIDQDGVNDCLAVSMPIFCDEKAAGAYQWSVALTDSAGTVLARENGNFSLFSGTNMVEMTFSAEEIKNLKVSGPYYVSNILLWNTSSGKYIALEGSYQTKKYLPSEWGCEPEIRNVTARQRFPWNGQVDIRFEVVGDVMSLNSGIVPVLNVSATNTVSGEIWSSAKLTGDIGAEEGWHDIVWDMGAECRDIYASNVVFNVGYCKTMARKYCIVDLSEGVTATNYPISYLDNVPVGGWTNEHKTTKLVLRYIEPGTFTMGDPSVADNPPHEVTLTEPFYIGIFELSQKQYALVDDSLRTWCGGHSYTKSEEYPAWVHWDEIKASNGFISKISEKTQCEFDLPTEAQWEYACRAGTTSLYNNGGSTKDDLAKLGRVCLNNYDPFVRYDPYGYMIGVYTPNSWGLYDMHGNLLELCLDWYGELSSNAVINPVGHNTGTYRVCRGGDYGSPPEYCTSAYRGATLPYETNGSPMRHGHMYSGARLVMKCPSAISSVGEVVCSGSSTETLIDLRDEPTVDFAQITYNSEWIGGNPEATVLITDNNVEIGQFVGKGEFSWIPTTSGIHDLKYMTYINGELQDEIYTATLHSNQGSGLGCNLEVKNVTARQRFPWNGLVDIKCDVVGVEGSTNEYKFVVAAVMPDSGEVREVSHIWTLKNGAKSTDLTVTADGNFRLLWDAEADLGQVRYSNMVVRVTLDVKHNVIRDKVQLWEGGPYWATKNIGAEKPEDSGYYFWWGDTVGYKRENGKWVASDGVSTNFSFASSDVPTYNKNIETLTAEGWVDADGALAPEHDAAQAHWGGDWRMPTKSDLEELCNKCDWTWTTNAVKGYIIRGRGNYASVSIFLPCYGWGASDGLYARSCGYYWSSTFDSNVSYAWDLSFDFSLYRMFNTTVRFSGQSIRPVQGGMLKSSLAAPTNVSATDGISTAHVTVTWAAVTGAEMYEIWRSTSNSSSLATKIATSTSTSYSDVSAIAGTTYYYWVKAVSSGGASAFSLSDSGYKKIAHDRVQLWEGGPYWATTNIGAEKPEDYGYYFWWGDTVGYKWENDKWVASDGSSTNFSFDTSNTLTMYEDTSSLQSKGWITANGVLFLEHDAAHVHWGGDWRMPTEQELTNLISKCSWTWTTMNGVRGYLICGEGDFYANSIFLPAAGDGLGTSQNNPPGWRGYYWSSVPDSYIHSQHLSFDTTYYVRVCAVSRIEGFPIRPVQGFSK